MNSVVYIGIDDTDNLESVGTGKVARGAAKLLVDLGFGESLGVSRHQLLVHPDIRYTSHNSSKGLSLKTTKDLSEFFTPCIDYLKSCYQPESDPGLCICTESQITDEIQEWGARAEKEVLTKVEAYSLAKKNGIFLQELGGDGGGVIGALASVGLRSTGNNGRLVEVKGIRDLSGLISVGEIKQKSDVFAVYNDLDEELADSVIIDSLDWIRPSLINWKPILRVVSVKDENGVSRWVPAEKAYKVTGGKRNDR